MQPAGRDTHSTRAVPGRRISLACRGRSALAALLALRGGAGGVLAAAIMVTAALAGCLLTEGPTMDGEPTIAPDPDIIGTVEAIDEAFRPQLLPDAEVVIPALGLSTRTDANGSFAFVVGAHAGTLEVVAAKEGYGDQSATVSVHPDLVVHIGFRLVPTGTTFGRLVQIEFEGFLPCTLHSPATGGVDCPAAILGDALREFRFPLAPRPGETLEEIEVMLQWDPAGPSGETLHVRLLTDGAAVAAASGPPGFMVALDEEALVAVWEAGVLDIIVDVDPEATGLTLAQRFGGEARFMYRMDD